MKDWKKNDESCRFLGTMWVFSMCGIHWIASPASVSSGMRGRTIGRHAEALCKLQDANEALSRG